VVHNCGSSLGDILDNPELLKSMTPEQIQNLAEEAGWAVGTLGKGSHKGEGLIVREVNAAGKLTGRMIQWHPGGGHHGPSPYWKVSSDIGGTVRVGPQYP
jgi:hypothetical protein